MTNMDVLTWPEVVASIVWSVALAASLLWTTVRPKRGGVVLALVAIGGGWLLFSTIFARHAEYGQHCRESGGVVVATSGGSRTCIDAKQIPDTHA